MADPKNEMEFHRAYYGRTAARYDTMNVHDRDEHFFAASALLGLLDYFDIRSVLEVGAGTGRMLAFLKSRRPDLRVMGIEPIAELREQGGSKGLAPGELVDGDGYSLQFEAGQFDLVCSFGVLHHVKEPVRVVDEMLRVARVGILVSDSNNFGQGSPASRGLKQLLDAFRLWRLADWVRTGGRGYLVNESDGLHYSYSVFNNFKQIHAKCSAVHLIGTRPSGRSLYGSASQVAVLGIK